MPPSPNSSSSQRYRQVAKQLTTLASICFLLIFILHNVTKTRIKRNESDYLNASLAQVLPAGVSLADFGQQNNKALFTHPVRVGQRLVYPACQQGRLRYALVEIATEQGYGGTIRLLVNLDMTQQRLIAARPLFHQETPGLGDQIDVDKSPWLQQFALPLNTPAAEVALVADGGKIDAITGATITSRAVSNVMAAQIFSLNPQALAGLCRR